MNIRSISRPATGWLVALVLLVGCGFALAQAEPTMNQVYEAAHAGHLDQAQTMMNQVLAAHPNSAKAHFVEAELLAQQGRLDAARQSLATAERLQPNLSFATPEAVSGLRSRLSGSGLNGLSGVAPRTSAGVPATAANRAATPATASPSIGLFWPVLFIVVIVALFLMFRRRAAAQAGGLVTPNGVPQGYAAGAPQPYGQGQPGQPYAQPYGQPGYGQPVPQQGSGLGSRIAGGLATGAAIGAGMMAAEAIGHSLTGHHPNQAAGTDAFGAGRDADASIPAGDLGGNNFGIQDTGWDDSSSVGSSDFVGGGGDWDS